MKSKTLYKITLIVNLSWIIYATLISIYIDKICTWLCLPHKKAIIESRFWDYFDLISFIWFILIIWSFARALSDKFYNKK